MKLNEISRRADRAVRLGAYPYASLLCERILRWFPGDARARSLLGQASLGAGDHERARQQFDLALEYDPEDATALAALGVVHSAEGRLGAAVKAFERAYDLNPANEEVRDSLARLYAERDGGPTAVPAAPPVAVARWRLRHEPLETALDAVNTLLVSQPGNVAVALARAEALWRSERFDDAERACRQILTRHPHFLKPRLILGLTLVSDARRPA
ncbi:MAG TPA: tetratricopeptide repeat protein, partial [Chloroflexota bacterium]|nr:tetratricopeptide repeat protein [Chloroflexota bacterium]